MAIGAGGVDLATLQNAAAAPKIIRASKTFTGAANLGAVGVNELFTTTGAVLIDGFWVRCTSDLVDAVDGALFKIGVTGADDIFTGAEFENAFDLDTIDAGDGLDNNTPVASVGWAMNLNIGQIASRGDLGIFANLIMTISTQAITGGVLQFFVLYRPLTSDGALSLGAGMVAI